MSAGESDKRKNGQPSQSAQEKDLNESVDNDSGVSGSSSQSSSSSSRDSDGEGKTTENQKDKIMAKENLLALHEVECKAEALSKFVVSMTLGCKNTKPSDDIEKTLLRCINAMISKHEYLFKGMVKKLNINNETAYTAFITVVNELFEGDETVVNWGRIIALYAFGGQLALYCRDNNLNDCKERIPIYLGRFAKDVISHFVLKEGGWKKLCEEYPAEDDIDQKIWKVLTWTAVGLSLATAASFLTSH